MIALTGGLLVELRPRRARRADLLIDGGRVVAVAAAGESALPLPDDARRIDCRGTLVLPGFVCAHTHLYSALARGMPPPAVAPTTFVEILERVWWKLDRALDEEAVEVSALLGAVEAARCGTTTLFDHHASPRAIDGSLDVVGAALEKVGLRGVLCYEVTDRGGPDEARAGLAENDRFLRRVRRAPGDPTPSLLRGLLGAHAGFTVGHDTAVRLADLARGHGVGLHVHVAEDAADARHLVPAREATIVEWLDEYRLLGPRSLLAHCVHVDDEGAARVAASGAHVAHNPRSNLNNAVGYARPARFGARLVLGTDGIGADMLAEAQVAFLASRHALAPSSHGGLAGARPSETPSQVPSQVPSQMIDPLALLAENQSLAAATFDEGIGRLEPGCPADVAVLEYDPPTPLDETNLFGHLLFGPASGAALVRDVLVAGREVVRDRRVVTVDEGALRARAREVARRLWQRMA